MKRVHYISKFSHIETFFHSWMLMFGHYFLNTLPCFISPHCYRGCLRLHLKCVGCTFPPSCSPLVTQMNWHQESREKLRSFCCRTEPTRHKFLEDKKGWILACRSGCRVFLLNSPLSLISFSPLEMKSKAPLCYNHRSYKHPQTAVLLQVILVWTEDMSNHRPHNVCFIWDFFSDFSFEIK